MSKNCLFDEMRKGGLLELIAGVQDHQYIDPPKHEGMYEFFGQRMNDFEKRAFAVMCRLEQQIQEKTAVASSKETSFNRRGILESEMRTLGKQHNSVRSMMHMSIKDRLNIWDKPLGVSKGFKIVIPEVEAITVIEIAMELPQERKDAIEAAIRESKSTKGEKAKVYPFPSHSTMH